MAEGKKITIDELALKIRKGFELVEIRIALTDKVLKMEDEIKLLKLEIKKLKVKSVA